MAEDNYSSKTAGSLMVANVPTVNEHASVADVEKLLLKEAKNFDSINYIYALNESGHLKGVFSIKEVFRSDKETAVKDLYSNNIVSVRPHTHQERAARLAVAHSIKAVPVVDRDNKFLGVVTNDTIINILEREGVEDILKFGGISHVSFDNILTLPFYKSLQHRLPWLVIGLFGGMVSASIVGSFEEVLSKNIVLAAFIPLMAYMANAVGNQMEAFIIRDFALNPKFNFFRYFTKQASVVVIIGIIVSLILYGINMVFYGDPTVSLVLGTALFLAIITSLVTGLVIPYLFGKMKFDPANASGPIATIIQDAISVFVYFYVASLLL